MLAPPLENGRVPGFLHFTPSDWRELARGQRALADRDKEDAARQSNPSMRDLFLENAKRCLERAEKCENAARVL